MKSPQRSALRTANGFLGIRHRHDLLIWSIQFSAHVLVFISLLWLEYKQKTLCCINWETFAFLRNITVQPGLFWVCVGSSNDQSGKLVFWSLSMTNIFSLSACLAWGRKKNGLCIGSPSRCLCVLIFPSHSALLRWLTLAGTAHLESTNSMLCSRKEKPFTEMECCLLLRFLCTFWSASNFTSLTLSGLICLYFNSIFSKTFLVWNITNVQTDTQ